MNEILQKRIEEKLKELAQKYFPNEMNTWARPNYEAQYVESACKEIVTFALQNQWISVDEALPKDYEDVFILYDHGIPSVGYCEKINDEIKWYRRIDRTPIIMVTRWMEIPLEGGEK